MTTSQTGCEQQNENVAVGVAVALGPGAASATTQVSAPEFELNDARSGKQDAARILPCRGWPARAIAHLNPWRGYETPASSSSAAASSWSASGVSS